MTALAGRMTSTEMGRRCVTSPPPTPEVEVPMQTKPTPRPYRRVPLEDILRGQGAAAINARKTHCIRGHPFSGDNLGIRPNGQRRCKACQREWNRVREQTRVRSPRRKAGAS